jgi:hypothetical protein
MALKGQVISQEAKEKMKQTKHATLFAKYNWDIVKDFFDTEIDLSSRNKQHPRITLRKFKEMIDAGSGVKEIHKQTSKSLVGFFSALCQGKITLGKEQFISEYEKGKSLEEIALENRISKDYIGYLRQLYGCKVKGATFINRKNTEVPLTQRQKEIIYGSLLGDAKKLCSNAIVAFKQCLKQEEYLKWKFEETKSVMSPNSLKRSSDIDKRTGKPSVCWSCYSFSNTDIENINKQFYFSGKKEITSDILDNLTPLSVAVWYMDDGTTDWSRNTRIEHPTWNISPEMRICTDSYSKVSCDNIVNWFKNKWNINCHLRERGLRKDGGTMYRVIIDVVSAEKFIALISPHILPLFQYKIDYKAYLKWKEEKDNAKNANDENNFFFSEENAIFDEKYVSPKKSPDIFSGKNKEETEIMNKAKVVKEDRITNEFEFLDI